MADTLVERLTGQKRAEDVSVEIQVLIKAEDLVDEASPLPVEVPGHGPIPAAFLSAEGRKTWRRLVTQNGIIIGGDSKSRAFTGILSDLVKHRDGGRCREPFCDAPIRHVDHIRRWPEGGRTEFDNGRGLCAFHNLVRELGDWRSTRYGDTVCTTTPTGHTYASTPERHTSVRRRRPKNSGVPLAFTHHGARFRRQAIFARRPARAGSRRLCGSTFCGGDQRRNRQISTPSTTVRSSSCRKL
jgi:hypothetical protein